MAGSRRPDRWRIDMTEQEQLRQLKEEYENMTIPEAGWLTAHSRPKSLPNS